MGHSLDRATDNIKSFTKTFASTVILMHGTIEIVKLVKQHRQCKPWEVSKKRAINEAVDKIMKVMEPHRSRPLK